MAALLYGDFVRNIARSFDNALSEVETVHNFEYGTEFEIVICKVLRSILPYKFGICRGYAINQEGVTAGDDIIIYERLHFPTIRRFGEDYTLKEKVPIEAVFAYIEAKNTVLLNEEGEDGSLHKAIQQTCAVKELCNQRSPVSSSTTQRGWPTILNPVYTAIFAHQVSVKQKSKNVIIKDFQQVYNHLENTSIESTTPPDFIVAGHSNIIFHGVDVDDPLGVGIASPFYVADETKPFHRVTENLAFGIGVTQLLWALDSIQLGPMPWSNIVVEGINLSYDAWVKANQLPTLEAEKKKKLKPKKKVGN